MNPIDTYLSVLAKLGASEPNLLRRRTFLSALLKDLSRFPHTEKVYGALVDARVQSFGQPEMRHFFKTSAREFYAFWIDDKARIEAIVTGVEPLLVEPVHIHLSAPIDALQALADEWFANQESHALSAYAASVAAHANHTDIRLQWARLILYAFRDFEPVPDMFRASVSAVAEAFPNAVQRESFLVVVREFYPLWAAANALNAESSAN
jgi:hypothetical protein